VGAWLSCRLRQRIGGDASLDEEEVGAGRGGQDRVRRRCGHEHDRGSLRQLRQATSEVSGPSVWWGRRRSARRRDEERSPRPLRRRGVRGPRRRVLRFGGALRMRVERRRAGRRSAREPAEPPASSRVARSPCLDHAALSGRSRRRGRRSGRRSARHVLAEVHSHQVGSGTDPAASRRVLAVSGE
jgi:hypothetical protein